MGILLWIIFGALAGWIASLLMDTDPQQGTLTNVIVGIIGAVIGGSILHLFGRSGVSGFNAYSLLVAVLGSVILIAVVRALS